MTAVMFAGPSLWDMRGKIPEGITVLPPAQCGDLLAAWRNGATRIGLVDGFFGTCRSVWHKEILAVLAAGVPVLGAASLGALRAAECAPFGMQGVGRVYHDYAMGRRWSDADVALIHGPAETGFMPLSVPLVDADDTLDALLTSGAIEQAESDLLRIASRDLGFANRTWAGIFAVSGLPEARKAGLCQMATQRRPAVKARDALRLALALQEACPHRTLPDFARTIHFVALEKSLPE